MKVLESRTILNLKNLGMHCKTWTDGRILDLVHWSLMLIA